MTDYIQVITTTATREDADRIAQTLVSRRLAACVQVSGPLASTYWWQGAIETASEFECVAKSRQDLFPQIELAICEVHPYQTPEILATRIIAGNEAYLDWLNAELQPPG
jgi:periplasmic divalent cation tolerance protein